MKKAIVLLLSIVFINCASNKPKSSFTENLFKNLEFYKCDKGEIDRFLLQSGVFKSIGTTKMKFGSPAKNYTTLDKYKTNVTFVSVMDDNKQYNLISNRPGAYNYILKNGTFKETVTNNSGITNMVYIFNNSKYLLEMEEVRLGGTTMKSYKITSWCYTVN